jgi:hypothetical protein
MGEFTATNKRKKELPSAALTDIFTVTCVSIALLSARISCQVFESPRKKL